MKTPIVYYTLVRNIRELQRQAHFKDSLLDYTLARNIRELQPRASTDRFPFDYTLARVIRISYFFPAVFLFYYILFMRCKKHFPSSHDMIKDAVWGVFFDQKAGTRVTWKLSSMYFLVASVWKIFTNFLYAGLSLSFSLAAMIFT